MVRLRQIENNVCLKKIGSAKNGCQDTKNNSIHDNKLRSP